VPKNLFLLTPAKTASLPLLSRFTASRSIRKFRYLEPLLLIQLLGSGNEMDASDFTE